jgi:hypothetical protein
MSNNRLEIRSWSPEEEAQLLALFDTGMTASEIGQLLGRTRLAVYGQLQRFHKQQGRVSRTNGRAFAQRAVYPRSVGETNSMVTAPARP